MSETLLPTSSSDAEDAQTIGRRSARSPRMEIITRGERRRVWTPEQKREIVAESLGPELTPTEVARKHAISSGLLYTWRQQVLGDQISVVTRTTPSFAQVELAPELRQLDAPRPESLVSPEPPPPASPRTEGLIEIMLPGGVSLRVDGQVDARALRRVLGALEGR